QTARSNRIRSLVRGSIDEQGTPRGVHRTQELCLSTTVESEARELLAVVSEGLQAGNDVAVHAAISLRGVTDGHRLGGVIDAVTERAVSAVERRIVERDRDRLRNVVPEDLHVVARVRANNLSRHDTDRSDLVRLDRLQRQARLSGRLLPTLRHPPGSRLRGAVRDLLAIDAEGDLAGKLHDRRGLAGLREVVLRHLRVKEPREVARVSGG